MMIHTDKSARQADMRFYTQLANLEKKVREICNGQGVNHYSIDEKNITLISDIEKDYKRRQGNLILGIAKFIKPEIYQSKRKHKVNDNAMKRSIAISHRKVGSLFKKFSASFGRENELLERDLTHRLRDIEKEMEEEKQKEQEKARKNYYSKAF